MQTKEQKISHELGKLITNIHRNADEQLINQIKVYGSRLMSSSMIGKVYQEDASMIKDKIITKVQKSYDARSVLQCQEACHRFLDSHTVSKKAEVLKMLYKLSEANEYETHNIESILHENITHKPKNTNLSQTQPSFNTSYQNNAPNRPSYLQEQLNMVRYRGSLEQGVSESHILKEITFCFQNITSQLILSDRNGISGLKPDVMVSDTVRRIVKELAEVGWLYKKITNKFNEEGAVTRALNLAIKDEMGEYYRWLAIIENMIKNEELTLRKLILWSYEPFEKLKWLAIILETARPFQGCQIISIINSYRPQGSNSINSLLNRLLGHLLQPLFQYIYNWVYRGELIDPNNQFFIAVASHKNVADFTDWRDKFFLKESNIPNVLDYQSAVQIFNAGKTLYFLKNHCEFDYKPEIEFPDPKTALSPQSHESISILSPHFRSWLFEISSLLNKKLVQVLMDKFCLSQHLNTVKMFFLVGKGDFLQSLLEMDSFREELNKPKHLIHEINLTEYIGRAINECFPDTKDKLYNRKFKEEFTDRLGGKKVHLDEAMDGWDLFNFDYAISDPINTLLSPQIMRKYQRIFHFLWRVKRIEQGLKQIWLSSAKDYPHGAQLPILHQCHIIRHSMTHFLNNLYGYLMISIESAWNKFTKKMEETDNFQGILQIHEKFMDELLEITLNTHMYKSANTQLSAIFKIISKFINIQNRLASSYSDFHEQYRVYVNRRNLIKKGLAFNEQLQAPVFNCEGLENEIDQAKVLYQQEFKRFYEFIKRDTEGRISSLCFRLDFSGFYTHNEYNF